MEKNVRRKPRFTQVCVWEDTFVGPEGITFFEASMWADFRVRVQYLEEIETGPDMDTLGNPVPGTGGRNDLVFAVHIDDLAKLHKHRLGLGIRWIEDVLAHANYSSPIYPARVFGYRSWDADAGRPQDVDWGFLSGWTVDHAASPHMK